MYKGPKCCAGCNKTGEESPRLYVDSLCSTCSAMIYLGRLTKQQNELEKEWITLRVFPWRIWDGQAGESHKLWKQFGELCKSMSRNEKDAKEFKSVGNYSSHDSIEIKVTPSQVECIEIMYKQFETSLTAIYNHAKKEGSNLLVSLNNGEITMKQFNESLK